MGASNLWPVRTGKSLGLDWPLASEVARLVGLKQEPAQSHAVSVRTEF